MQLGQAVPYTSPDSFDLGSLGGTTLSANGGLGDTTAAQGVLVIPGIQNNPGHSGVLGGTVLANIYAALASQATIPGAIFLSGQQNYIIHHIQKNVAQTDHEGFKLQYSQIPCNSAGVYYETSGL
jgi:hypothetical protein